MVAITHYPNVKAFYRDRGGANSGERDYGAWHYDDVGLFSPRTEWPLESEELRIGDEVATVFSSERNSAIRVSVVDETGDVYAEQGGLGEGRVALIGNVGVKNLHFRAPRTVRGHIGPVYRRANEILTGWSKMPVGRGISWFISRLAEAARNPETQEDRLAELTGGLAEMRHAGFGLVDGILPQGAEEMFEKFTMVDAIVFLAYGMYSERHWDTGWAKPDEWYGVSPNRTSFRDWLLYEFRYQLPPLMQIDAEELAEVRYQWIAAMEIVSEELYQY